MNPNHDDNRMIPKSIQMTDDKVTELKRAINEVLWMYAPGNMTLGDAEDLSCEFLGKIVHYRPKGASDER